MDGEGAAISADVLADAEIVLTELGVLGMAPARIYPTIEGGVQAEWTKGRCEASITFGARGLVYVMLVDTASGESKAFSGNDVSAATLAALLCEWARELGVISR
jgi:hypothetical protein